MSDQEARKAKLEELRKRKQARETKTNNLIEEFLQESTSKPKEEKKDELVPIKEEAVAAPKAQKKQDLKTQRFVGEISITAREKIETYNQEIQVDLGELEGSPLQARGRTASVSGSKKDKQTAEDDLQDLPQKANVNRAVRKSTEEIGQSDQKTQDAALQELSAEEVKSIFKSKDFMDFFDRGSKMIEKALDSKNVDLLEDLLMDDSNTQYQDGAARKDLQEVHTFYDQALCSNRVVTSIDWSPQLPELFLTSYSQSFEGNPNEPQGVLLLWSLSLRSRPEFTCYCQSQVTVAKFNPYSTSTIIGGTYSGQIVIWDLRVKSTPVQRSGMAAGGHAHPVYCLDIVGTQNSNNIISLSNDGKLCTWNTTMLTSPSKETDLKIKVQGDAQHFEPINPSCLTFPHEEANNFYTGVEDGTIYSAQVHGNQSNENIVGTFTGHQAPITSLSVMPYFQDVSSDVSNLLLSSSYDWTVKLWNPKTRSEFLWSFESTEDYIYDVAWNPSNPTLFTSVDGDGFVDLWDLSKDLEVPLLHHKSDTRALNKVSWSKDGTRLVTGSSSGYLKLFGLHKNLHKASEEAMDKFETQIYNIAKKDKKE